MQSLIITDQSAEYGANEAGPLVLALAFVIALGGVTAAAIIICGWGNVKSIGVSWAKQTVEILCR